MNVLEKKLFLDPVILYQTKRFRFQDRKSMLKYKLSIPGRSPGAHIERESKACISTYIFDLENGTFLFDECISSSDENFHEDSRIFNG